MSMVAHDLRGTGSSVKVVGFFDPGAILSGLTRRQAEIPAGDIRC